MKIDKTRIERIKHETNINKKKSKNAKTIKRNGNKWKKEREIFFPKMKKPNKE